MWSLGAAAIATSAITFKEFAVRNGVKLPLLMASQVIEQTPGTKSETVFANSQSYAHDKSLEAIAVAPKSDEPQIKTISASPVFAGDQPNDQSDIDPTFVGPPEPDWFTTDEQLRWFHGRPIRPAKVLWMRVTAYSPDEKSCGTSADGRTATMHCVTTNAFLLVAADPNVLPYGSMLTIPGYAAPEDAEKIPDVDITANWANERAMKPGAEGVVPVLDCGGAIKGFRLDLLFPTHESARAWGTKMLPVTVWEYADGKPKPNPRRLR